MKTYLEKTGR